MNNLLLSRVTLVTVLIYAAFLVGVWVGVRAI